MTTIQLKHDVNFLYANYSYYNFPQVNLIFLILMNPTLMASETPQSLKNLLPPDYSYKLAKTFSQSSVFELWYSLSSEQKKELSISYHSITGNSYTATEILSSSFNIHDISFDFKDDIYYPIGKISKQSKSGYAESYWELTAMPLNAEHSAFVYLIDDRYINSLNTNYLFVQNTFNSNTKNIWNRLYDIFDFKSSEKKFFIGGHAEPNFSKKELKLLRKQLVSASEITLYIQEQDAIIAKNYFETKQNFNSELSDMQLKKRYNSLPLVSSTSQDVLLAVNSFLQSKINELNSYLEDDSTPEHTYQRILLEIFPFIFPKYTHFIKEYSISITGNSGKNHDRPDFLALNTNYSVDIIEIKKPTINIFKKTKYRENHVFSGEINGLITQAEKYIFNISRHAENEEPKIFQKFKNDAYFKGESIHINSPKAIIIAGRSLEFKENNAEMLIDFEIMKQKISDIEYFLTYDDILDMLQRILDRQVSDIKLNN